ncbi:MAG: ferredoxin [Sporolactobacillus sp.]
MDEESQSRLLSIFTRVNKETCISCGACQAAAPDIFDEDDSGLAFSLIDNNQGIRPIPEELLDDLDDAEEGCPTESILIANQPFQPVENHIL